jgi:hypothetical protein
MQLEVNDAISIAIIIGITGGAADHSLQEMPERTLQALSALDRTRIRPVNPAFNYGFFGLIQFPLQESIRKIASIAAILLVQASENKPA